MGKVLSIAARQANRFNVESRAEKVISQSKPKPAPKFQSNLKDLQRVLDENPDILQELNKKNVPLDDNLKRVFVTSTDVITEPSRKDPDKPLPLNRTAIEEFEYGHLEPQSIPKGRCTLRQAIEFISKHQTEPEIWTSSKVSAEYAMKEALVSNILKHFKTFELHLPDKAVQKRKLLMKADSNKTIE
ncbi:protein NDUFAF4 homolog [Aedes albopictus]|uniref:NADH dehydrogenase [ubiquinone] 1 alpha subcomplex assembly factor 4 n=1 Tax=Aedes albopictus TaxID=7160 RepID=A0ABM1XP27_AEDAL|nr:protein NDUFAF4 homolog [Aedes albopictus]